ncbi:MAG: LamG domain-containing protein, partial [Sedimentisphaerales bacterium]|nr:LamG domain-containing protein [Sedimentisphaerales bacterium]
RATVSDPWGLPVNLGPRVNLSAADDDCPSISADGRTLYFTSNRPGGYGSYDFWQAPIIPVVDFNGDEIVDINDLVILIEHWGQDDPSVDIGPMPWGDGVVDSKDLEVLMSYWGQEFPTVNWQALAYWRLDEAQGNTAQDSAGDYDGTLYGEPVWQPTAGKVNGALQLDGIDDYFSTPFVLNPSAGAFSVFAWVKGGTPGQVIISQTGGANWLLADPSGGNLMTELKVTYRYASALLSQTLITDGNWHRVCFVWDGKNRILYVDDVEVAKDTQTSLTSSTGGLYIGAGSNLAAGSFWSGLIDDVRIYNRAVTP